MKNILLAILALILAALLASYAEGKAYTSMDANGSYVALGVDAIDVHNGFGGFVKVGNAKDGNLISLGGNYKVTDTIALYAGPTFHDYNHNEFKGYEFVDKKVGDKDISVRKRVYKNTSRLEYGADLGAKWLGKTFLVGIGYNTAVNEAYVSAGVRF